MKDLTGQKFGKLTVLNLSKYENKKYMWNTICDCGTAKEVWTSNLTRLKITSCGCSANKPSLIGEKFGYGTVISASESRRESNRQEWILLCDCGNRYTATTSSLRGKISCRTTSCGCMSTPSGSKSKYWKGHGEITGAMWSNIIGRCKRSDKEYLVCDISIAEAYEIYLRQSKKCVYTGWDLSFGETIRVDGKVKIIKRTASLDRIDSSKGYTNSNVQWIHKHVNSMKNSYSEEYFLKICNAITNYTLSKGGAK